jgi:predicted transcriptional regulator
LTITLRADWADVLRAAAAQARNGLSGGGYRGETLNFETPAAFFGRLSSRRWELVRVLQQEGACGVRELARRVGRDVRRVHEDAAVLAEIGLIESDDKGKLRCPYADIHVDMHLSQAA